MALLESFFEGDIFDEDSKVLVRRAEWSLGRLSYSQARASASASGSLVCSIIAALSDSSSVGMGGISCLCGLVL